MKNLTVAVPEDVYRAARVHAAQQGTSVSSLVANYLRSLSNRDAEFHRLTNMQDEVIREVQGFRATDNVSRDELHDRAALR